MAGPCGVVDVDVGRDPNEDRDVYRGGVYEAALETIDRKLGKEKGTFASL